MIEDSLVRSLVASKLERLVHEVGARALDESGALLCEPLELGHDLRELPVWGIDA